MSSDKEIIIVFEICKDCNAHNWNTRHEEAKYAEMYSQVSSSISKGVPRCTYLVNKVPKKWAN